LYFNEPSEAMVVLFDLRDPDAWLEAGAIRKAWGPRFSEVYTLDADHVAVVLKPGAAGAEASA
jgi:hypothetical protein